MARRSKGEGGITRVHDYTCPPAVDGERPRHTCKHPAYRWSLDLGTINGQRIRKTGRAKTRAEAIQAKTLAQQQIEQGIIPDTTTVGEWLNHWLHEIAELKPATRKGYTSYLTTWLEPYLGGIELQKLRPDHIRAMQKAMRAKGLAESTVVQTNAILKSALTVAVNEQRVPRNVAKLTTPKQPERRPHPTLTAEQAQAVIAAAPDLATQARLMVALMAGLRQGEALALRWPDVHLDTDRPYIDVQWSVVYADGGYVRQRPKSRTSIRKVPLIPAAANTLRAWREVSDLDGYVFPSTTDKPLHARVDAKRWYEALARAGVPRIPVHGARGTAATYLIRSGVPITSIQKFLGHSDISVTVRSYAHVTDDLLAEGMEALNAFADNLSTPARKELDQ